MMCMPYSIHYAREWQVTHRLMPGCDYGAYGDARPHGMQGQLYLPMMFVNHVGEAWGWCALLIT